MVIAWAQRNGHGRYHYDSKGGDFWRSLAWQAIDRRLTSEELIEALDNWDYTARSRDDVIEGQRDARRAVCTRARKRYPDAERREQMEAWAHVTICDLRRAGHSVPWIEPGQCAEWVRTNHPGLAPWLAL